TLGLRGAWTRLPCTTLFRSTISCIVEQLGLAMMPRGRLRRVSGLTSATTSGTSSSRRNSDELSITTAPAAANFSAYCLDTRPPRSEEHTSELQSRENLVCRL